MLLNLVHIIYKKRPRKGKQPPYVTPVFLTTLSKKSLGEAAATATRTRSSFTGVSQCAENSSESCRHFEISVPCQLYPASRSALTRVSHREAPGNWLHVKLLRKRNLNLLKSVDHQKRRLSQPRIFPCDAAANANAQRWQQQQHRCLASPIWHPSQGILNTYSITGNLKSLAEWMATCCCHCEPAAITMARDHVLLHMCVRAVVPFSFLLHQHLHSQLVKHKAMPENHVPTLTAATLMTWSQSN